MRSAPWLLALLRRELLGPRPPRGGPRRLLLCIADHFEPRRGRGEAGAARGLEVVRRWVRDYPEAFGDCRDADGRPPRHTFFYPIEEYDDREVAELGKLCLADFGEIEIHLHHQNSTSDRLRSELAEAVARLSAAGQLARRGSQSRPEFGFIHGNWALDNALPGGAWCGINDELDVLRESGCYADFTMPSAPAGGQTRTINSIYWAVDDPMRPKSHDSGTPLGNGPAPDRALLMVQGPLALDWGRRKWGVLPRLENGCLQGSQPPGIGRLGAWLRAGVGISSKRPDWRFVKLHAHGADDRNLGAMLGEPMVRFHRDLADLAARDDSFTYHYVTARELANLALAADSGYQGDVAGARDGPLRWIGTM